MILRSKLSFGFITLAALATIHCSKKDTAGQSLPDVQITGASTTISAEPPTGSSVERMAHARKRSALFKIEIMTARTSSELTVSRIEYFNCEDNGACEDSALLSVTESQPVDITTHTNEEIAEHIVDSALLGAEIPMIDSPTTRYVVNVSGSAKDLDSTVKGSFHDLDITPSNQSANKVELSFRLDQQIYNSLKNNIRVVVTTNKGVVSAKYVK